MRLCSDLTQFCSWVWRGRKLHTWSTKPENLSSCVKFEEAVGRFSLEFSVRRAALVDHAHVDGVVVRELRAVLPSDDLEPHVIQVHATLHKTDRTFFVNLFGNLFQNLGNLQS